MQRVQDAADAQITKLKGQRDNLASDREALKAKLALMESDLAYYHKHHNGEPPRTTKKAIAESYSNSKSASRLGTERRLSTP